MTIQLATRVHTQDKNQAVKVWEESKKYRANREGVKTAALEEKNGCCVQARAKGTACTKSSFEGNLFGAFCRDVSCWGLRGSRPQRCKQWGWAEATQ